MLKASLQLRLGQQLTMTPQLQQAIRLLQLPALELQAHIRELLESNVMLEAEDDTESTATFESLGAGPNDRESPANEAAGAESGHTESDADPAVEILEDGWQETSAAPGEAPWQSDDDERQQEFSDGRGESLHEHLLWQLEMARLDVRQRAIGRAVIDAVNDAGYITEPFDAIAATLKPEIESSGEEIAAMLQVVQSFDPLGVAARDVSECLNLQLRALDPATPGLPAALAIASSKMHRSMEGW
jgi:RNA polymerase sigma-54 factor